MRVTIFSLMLAGTLAVGCSRTDAEHARATRSRRRRRRASASAAAPVATAGRADAPRAAEAVPAAGTTWREITIPAGTTLERRRSTPPSAPTPAASSSRHGAPDARGSGAGSDRRCRQGSRVSGVVTDATRSAKVKGRAHVAVRFDSVTPRGNDQRYTIRTSSVGRTAAGTKQKDAMEIGAPAAGGAIIGALFGGKKGALVGTAVGGGAGTGGRAVDARQGSTSRQGRHARRSSSSHRSRYG